ncbi:acetylornithine/N-succinyldiaminopimelate aminotransferase [Tistlia consotensis]|uniref:Acetylornithine aminotransferase n=1 Tax=Tistlia consotensis USBA 355 TaxID=560819 RepID=A0A1Y6BJY8_9PROT|nr:aspartate aminotransferase family protein [Tistlia consotensis]SMF06897.1 acetylornithine/N-succinyldiaminopimelate aminotransferase [Tistlia consotensis USBA 355]SNR36234.1 acetylornithine/N-succinyldiaminopimelate aminotransferase [Tistlia consotensis]
MSEAMMNTYARADLAFERGEGSYLFGTDGRRYLDFTAGIAVTSCGHAHPHLVKALQDQAAKLWHTSNLFRIPAGERLAERLVAASFADKVFFCNSGVEAFEGAAKLARRYQNVTGSPQRWKIITVTGSFHGRSMAAISAAGNPKYLEGFGPRVPGYETVAFRNTNELRAAIDDETAAILVEPIQGEGGIRPAELDYLRELRTICDEFGLVLVFDEIQCGMGRTGKLFACEWAGIAPDVMMLAKGLGGGFPIGAVLANDKTAVGFTPGVHGTTFGGNPLAMAVGNAVLDVILAEGFLDRVQEVAGHLRSRLEAIAGRHPEQIEEVRGAGLMLGLKAARPNAELIGALREAGLLTVGAAENVIRLLPPLTLSSGEADEACAIIEKVCASAARKAAE